MNYPKPKVGDILYRVKHSNYSNILAVLPAKIVVTKVGRQYFSVADPSNLSSEHTYRLKDWKAKDFSWSKTDKIYPSLAAFDAEKDQIALATQMQHHTPWERLPIEKLRQIKQILEA